MGDGAAQALGEVRGERGQESRFGRGEVRAPAFAQQGDAAPGDGADDQRRAQFVAEPVRSAEVAVARAAVELAAGRLAEEPAGTCAWASAGNLLKSASPTSISVIRGIASGGNPFSMTSPVGSTVAGSNVSTQTPSKGTARRRMRAASSNSRTSPPR